MDSGCNIASCCFECCCYYLLQYHESLLPAELVLQWSVPIPLPFSSSQVLQVLLGKTIHRWYLGPEVTESTPNPSNMADPQYAEEQSATTPEGGSNPSTDQTLQWYRPEIGDKLNAQTRKLLEEYSGIPPDEVEAHCYAVVCLTSPLPFTHALSSSLCSEALLIKAQTPHHTTPYNLPTD